MSHLSKPLTLELRHEFSEGGQVYEKIQTIEMSNPQISHYELETHDGWTLTPAEIPHATETITMTGSLGLYEKIRRVVTDCQPTEFYVAPPTPPPSQRMLVPALAVLVAMLAIVLLASGLG